MKTRDAVFSDAARTRPTSRFRSIMRQVALIAVVTGFDARGRADDALILQGTVRGRDGALARATVRLSLHRSDGELVWQAGFSTDTVGRFGVRASDLPLLPGAYAAVVAAEAPSHLAGQTSAMVQITDQGVVVSPSRIEILLPTYAPWLTVAALTPALFGMVLALLHLTRVAGGLRISYLLAFGAAILWSLVVAALTIAFARHGDSLMPLFWPDLLASTGTLVFAYLGTVVYVAYSLYQRGAGFYDNAPESTKRQVLMTLGGRLLVSPYVALVGHVILASTFPILRTGAFAAFFGFFTGLWIKPVLDALNDVGTRFLSHEARERLLQRMSATTAREAPPAPSATSAAFRPEPALLEAIGKARSLLLQKDGVIGVDAGYKVLAEDVGAARPGMVAYVYQKADPARPEDRVPSELLGFPVSVVELPRQPQGPCSSLMPRLSWAKVHADNQRRLGRAPSAPSVVSERSGAVTLLLDARLELFQGQEESQRLFDAVGAFKLASLGDGQDFVSFVIDPALWPSVPAVRDGKAFAPSPYHIGVYSDIRGTNYAEATRPGWYAEREVWGSPSLRACCVITREPRSLWTHLHELGHYWSAYVTLSEPDTHALLAGAEGQGRFHWSDEFDSGRSCVDWDGCEWVEAGAGLFERRALRVDREQDSEYCDLDLYLMGLLDASAVKPLRVLRDRRAEGGGRYRARVENVSIDRVISACGARSPSSTTSPKSFRVALVVVSNEEARGRGLASELDAFRPDLEAAFNRATRKLASIDTRA